MAIQRAAPRTSTIEVLDRILDKGVVIDAQVRVSLVGLHLVDIDARVIVSSIETYVKHAADLAEVQRQPRMIGAPSSPRAMREPARRRASRSRRLRPRAQPLVTYRCPSGCAFSRPPLARGEVAAACPYIPDVNCELQRV